ncbi:hypothetical protein [Siminovitchia fordii]|uniref:hypothetical protein n=1 Tax=Siminovitchia fordii TaxID=254759 RepID=UPI00146D46A1|nr:hypothetical protein [Siminovitchia fordii]
MYLPNENRRSLFLTREIWINPVILWNEIEAIDLINFSGQIYLGIFTFDRELIISRTAV